MSNPNKFRSHWGIHSGIEWGEGRRRQRFSTLFAQFQPALRSFCLQTCILSPARRL